MIHVIEEEKKIIIIIIIKNKKIKKGEPGCKQRGCSGSVQRASVAERQSRLRSDL